MVRDEMLLRCDEISALIQKTFGFRSCVLNYRRDIFTGAVSVISFEFFTAVDFNPYDLAYLEVLNEKVPSYLREVWR